MRVKYEKGVFKPLEKITGLEEGEELEVYLDREEWKRFAMNNPAFDFLKNEPEIYRKEDIIE